MSASLISWASVNAILLIVGAAVLLIELCIGIIKGAKSQLLRLGFLLIVCILTLLLSPVAANLIKNADGSGFADIPGGSIGGMVPASVADLDEPGSELIGELFALPEISAAADVLPGFLLTLVVFPFVFFVVFFAVFLISLILRHTVLKSLLAGSRSALSRLLGAFAAVLCAFLLLGTFFCPALAAIRLSAPAAEISADADAVRSGLSGLTLFRLLDKTGFGLLGEKYAGRLSRCDASGESFRLTDEIGPVCEAVGIVQRSGLLSEGIYDVSDLFLDFPAFTRAADDLFACAERSRLLSAALPVVEKYALRSILDDGGADYTALIEEFIDADGLQKVVGLLSDPEVLEAIAERPVEELLNDPEVLEIISEKSPEELLRDPKIQKALEELGLSDLVNDALRK